VFFALIESWKDKWDEGRGILTDETDDPVIVPEVQCPLGNLSQQQKAKVTWRKATSNPLPSPQLIYCVSDPQQDVNPFSHFHTAHPHDRHMHRSSTAIVHI